MTDDAATVTFTVTGFERIEGHGRLLALAALEIDFEGVILRLQGVQVIRQGKGITTQAPRFRNPQDRDLGAGGDPAGRVGRGDRAGIQNILLRRPAGYLRTRPSRRCSARPSTS